MRRFVIALAALMLAGCEETRVEYSPDLLQEVAVVAEAKFVPAHTDLVPTFGLDFNMNPTIGVELKSYPDYYYVALKSKCGFVFGSWESYETFKGLVGTQVDVYYREVYRVTYDKPGSDKELRRVFERCAYERFSLR